jgi:hypothetical protein
MLQMEQAQQNPYLPSGPGGTFRDRPPRTRTCLNGKLVHRDGIFTHDCTVRDISDGGAKIILSVRELLPPELFLIVVKRRIAYRATIVWLQFPARGLKFSETYQLEATLPKELKFLHQIWVDLCARGSGASGPGYYEVALVQSLNASTY